jgi:hypothetical protein
MGCSDIGIISNNDDWEYPFLVLLQQSGLQRLRIEHVNVKNASAVMSSLSPFNEFDPCVILSVSSLTEKEEGFVYHGTLYTKGWYSAPVQVFVRQP